MKDSNNFTLKDFLDLTKFRLTGLVMVTTLMGMYTSPWPISPQQSISATLLITLLVMGACTLNCVMEFKTDSLMERTKNRPIPANRISKSLGLIIGLTLIIFPVIGLALTVNPITSIIGLISALIYLIIYTPFKKISPYAVYLGAIPGALPPLMGQVATSGTISISGIILFSLLFWWQIPHFMAISIRYADDYAKGGILTFPKTHGINITQYQMIGTALLTAISGLSLLLISPYLKISTIGLFLIFLINILFFIYILRGLFLKNVLISLWARKVFFSTIIYLPTTFIIIMIF